MDFKQMSIGGKTYKVKDEAARDEIGRIGNLLEEAQALIGRLKAELASHSHTPASIGGGGIQPQPYASEHRGSGIQP